MTRGARRLGGVRGVACALALVLASSALSPAARADTAAPAPPRLRDRFGVDVAARLMRSNDPDERLRGVERAAAIHTPEGLALLIRAAANTGSGGLDPRLPMEGVARTDPRALLAAVRGLAAWSDHESARAVLAAIVSAPAVSFATRPAAKASADPTDDEALGVARVALARQQAARALAASGSTLAIDALVAVARGGGPGQTPALEALAADPPVPAASLGGVTLTTTPMIALATEVGDLRALDGVLAALQSSDVGLRAAAITALGVAGDARVLDAAHAAASESDGRLRIAAAGALVRLGDPAAPAAVAALVADDATASDGLEIAALVPDEDVTRAAAARAAASADASLRAAAIRALGRQTSPRAVRVLATLTSDAGVGGDAAAALARSPSPAAMEAIAAMAARAADARIRRLAMRAYWVRRFTRGERSAPLDALADALRHGGDPRDRALGVEVGVTFGEMSLPDALADPDVRVRRAAAAGALARIGDRDVRACLLSRLRREPDPITRSVLMTGFAGGDPGSGVPSSVLVERAEAGGADAPLAAMVLAQRAEELPERTLRLLLLSRDAVVRAHAMRGLGRSRSPEALGRLAEAYAWEADAAVRRAILRALAERDEPDAAVLRRPTLELAATLDPDAEARWVARRALVGRAPRGEVTAVGPEVAWLQLLPATGSAPLKDETAQLVAPGDLAVPVAFDDDGFALVPGVFPGEARVRLAPRLPPYSASSP